MNRKLTIGNAAHNHGQLAYPDDKDKQYAATNAFNIGAAYADAHPNWVSIYDQLPQDGELVLVALRMQNGWRMELQVFYQREYNEVEKSWLVNGVKVENYMPLPEPPLDKYVPNIEYSYAEEHAYYDKLKWERSKDGVYHLGIDKGRIVIICVEYMKEGGAVFEYTKFAHYTAQLKSTLKHIRHDVPEFYDAIRKYIKPTIKMIGGLR